MIGLKRGTVKLCEHEKEWEIEAQNTISRLKKILGNVANDIQHVGSTAIPSIKAKPIIDIAVAVDDFNDVLALEKELKDEGFYYRPQSDLGGQLLFASGSLYEGTGDLQTHFIHVVRTNSMDWINYINFRDYLNSTPTVAKEYEELKVSLAMQAPIDSGREKYLKGKHDFIVYTLRKALVKSYLGKTVDIIIDRPIGYVHKKEKYSLTYPINYGYIPGVLGGDGEELDVYLLGVSEPVTEYCVKIIGIVHRENDVEDKLVAAPKGINFTKDEIEKAVYFQEQYYKTYVEVEKMLTHKGTETIHTKRLILRKFKVEDANDMFVWASNPEVVKYLSYKPHTSPEATADLLKGWVGAYNSNQVYNWAIELNGIVVGSISVVDSSDKCSYCHLGWQIDKPFWNKGYMTEAAKAVVDFLFSKVGYNRIQSGHDARNIGSGRVMQKVGMTLEGTLREYCLAKDGSIGDKHLWAILKSDWKNKD